MRFLRKTNLKKTSICRKILSILLGGITAFVIRNYLTLVIFEGKNFTGRSPVLQIALFTAYTIAISIIYYLFLNCKKLPILKLRTKSIREQSYNQRVYVVIFLLGFIVALISFLNNIFPMIHTGDLTFGSFRYFYYMAPVGGDFRTGIYQPPSVFLASGEYYLAYPPFTNVFFMPLQLFNENTAYLITVFLLFSANILSLVLASIIIRDLILSRIQLGKNVSKFVALLIAFVFIWFTLSSYSFLFSIERGNYDAIAILFGVAAIYLLIKKPESIWWQVILLSIATHLKLYPAALFVVLLIKHRKNVVIPIIVVNSLMLFSLGFRNGLKFISLIIEYTQAPALGPYNHSGYGYAQILYKAFPDIFTNISLLRISLIVIPILIWAFATYLVVKHLKSEVRYIYLLMISIPLMCIVPTVSHDYKLIILSPALLIFFSILAFKFVHNLKIWDFLQMLLLFMIMFFVGRTYALFPPSMSLISNKYPMIVGLMILMLINIIPLRNLLNREDEPMVPDLAVDVEPAALVESTP